jgi:hypothetical protein
MYFRSYVKRGEALEVDQDGTVADQAAGRPGGQFEKDRLKREKPADELAKLKAECGGRDQGKFDLILIKFNEY